MLEFLNTQTTAIRTIILHPNNRILKKTPLSITKITYLSVLGIP
ncbi:hypothetical protein [Flavobacterium crassostreae]|nr:hypothetical protein [Flavobacterium crassostreae]